MTEETPDNAARATPCGWTCTDDGGENYVYDTNPCWAAKYPDRWLPVYSAATVAALEAEVADRRGRHERTERDACMWASRAEAATRQADAAERRVAELRELCGDMLKVFEAARPLVLNLERLRDAVTLTGAGAK